MAEKQETTVNFNFPWLFVLGIALVALKCYGVQPFAQAEWWLIALPLGIAVGFWIFAIAVMVLIAIAGLIAVIIENRR